MGLDVIGLGEHHHPDFVSSAPEVLLAAAAAAARTKTIYLITAVIILSPDDPVRVFQRFTALDLLSGGRVEIMAGRGSFIESFPLFGYDLADYDEIFAQKLDLLLRLCETERVIWSGRHRPPLTGQVVYPRPLQATLPVWIAAGGTPQSVVRAAALGLPLALAIIGGWPEWPWYAYVAPISWQVADVHESREKFNISKRPSGEGDEAAEEVQEGAMPIGQVPTYAPRGQPD